MPLVSEHLHSNVLLFSVGFAQQFNFFVISFVTFAILAHKFLSQNFFQRCFTTKYFIVLLIGRCGMQKMQNISLDKSQEKDFDQNWQL